MESNAKRSLPEAMILNLIYRSIGNTVKELTSQEYLENIDEYKKNEVHFSKNTSR